MGVLDPRGAGELRGGGSRRSSAPTPSQICLLNLTADIILSKIDLWVGDLGNLGIMGGGGLDILGLMGVGGSGKI